MKPPKFKSGKRDKSLELRGFTRSEVDFAVTMIRKTVITPELLAVAEARASRSRNARTAGFLDKYRVNAVA